MTQINRLTANVSIDPNDSFPLWSVEAGRTRRVTGQTLIEYITQKNIADAEFNSEGHLILTLNNGDQIDAGELPKAVLKIDDQPVGEIYTEGSINAQIEDGVATFSVNNAVTLWPIHEVGIGDSPFVIDSPDQLGIEYQYTASSQFTQSMMLNKNGLPEGAQVKVTVYGVEEDSKPIYVTQIRQGQDFTWPVSTPTVFTLRSGDWRVEESSQLLHIQNSTTFDDDAARKRIIHGVAADPNSSITMTVNDDGILIVGGEGSDTPTFKRVDIDTAGSGNPNFTASIHQDAELHTVIDATRELRINHKDIGTGTTTTIAGIDNSQAQFLVPIYQGVDRVALAKDVPPPPEDIYIEKYTRADTDYLQIAYQGKYDDERVFHPAVLNQGLSGRTNLEFTYEWQVFHKNQDTGERDGNPVFTVKQNEVDFSKPIKYQGKPLATTDGVLQEISTDKAKGIYIGGVHKETLTDNNNSGDVFDCGKPKHWIEFKKTSVAASQYLIRQTDFVKSSEISIHLHPDSGLDQVIFRVATSDGKYMQRIIRSDEKWRFFTYEGEYPYFEKIDDGSTPNLPPSNYFGQGLAVPKHVFLGSGEVTQSGLVGYYINTLNDGSSYGRINLNNDEGNNEFRVIIDGNTRTTRDYRVSLGIGNQVSEKRVRTGELWECRVFADWDDINEQNFFWTRLDNGVSQLEFRDASVLDSVESVGFDTNDKVTEIHNVQDIKYRIVDIPKRIYTGADVNIFLDSSKPIGSFQLDNACNYNWDYPELTVRVYVDNTLTKLGAFTLPYGIGATVKYNLDNKSEPNLSKGYWTWNLSVVDWSVIKRAAHAGILDQVDTSGFDAGDNYVKVLKKKFEDKDLISIPVELPDDMQIFVSSVICNVNGRLRKQPFEYQYENGILRVHLNEVCSGIIIAEMIK